MASGSRTRTAFTESPGLSESRLSEKHFQGGGKAEDNDGSAIDSSCNDLTIAADLSLNLTYINPEIRNILGYSAAALQRFYQWQTRPGLSLSKRPPGVQVIQQFLQQQLQNVTADCHKQVQLKPSTQQLWVKDRQKKMVCLKMGCSPLCDNEGQLSGLLCIVRDITQRKAEQENVNRAARVFQSSPTGIYITDERGCIIQMNQAFSRITGYRPEEIMGVSPGFIKSSSVGRKKINESLKQKDYWEGELQFCHKSGHLFPASVAITVLKDHEGSVIHTVHNFTDITEKKNSEMKIQRLAYFDPLSGLPNRSLFHDRLSRALNRARRANNYVALMFMDLDRFKSINDSLGHALGDALLQQVAQRLSECVRHEDTVARLGGDEFSIILGALPNRQQAIMVAAHIAEKIRHVLAQPFRIKNREVYTSVSIGIAFYPSDGCEIKTLLQNADTAMYHVKSQEKNNYQFYTQAMNAKVTERLELESALRKAVKKSLFTLYYQPVFNLRSEQIIGAEAFLRWPDPDNGIVSPPDFMEIAEDSGLIKPLGNWALRQACEQLRAWQLSDSPIQKVTVNISAKQFVSGYLLQSLQDIVHNAGINASQLVIELTETTLMQDYQYSIEILSAIKNIGIQITIDKFGTGFTSLNHLRKLPVDMLKVDCRFVAGLPGADDRKVIEAVAALGQSMRLSVIAQGVETACQLNVLRSLGYKEAQGFYWCRALPLEQLSDYVEKRTDKITAGTDTPCLDTQTAEKKEP